MKIIEKKKSYLNRAFEYLEKMWLPLMLFAVFGFFITKYPVIILVAALLSMVGFLYGIFS